MRDTAKGGEGAAAELKKKVDFVTRWYQNIYMIYL
jgi:hypothetical protein